MSDATLASGAERVLDVDDKPNPPLWLVLSLQHLFAMFGATILVPVLTGLIPNLADNDP